MSKNKLYSVFLTASIIGYAYFIYSINHSESAHLSVCMIKSATGYPCPSCGTTRAIQSLVKGDFISSLLINPFGIIVAVLMAVVPFWILYDWIIQKETFFNFYRKSEKIIQIRAVAFVLIAFVLVNWIWNIHKEL